MIRLFVFDERANSSQNGIGTYISDMCQSLSEEIEITVLSFNDRVSTFQKEERGGVSYMRFPAFCGGAFLYNYEVGLSLVRMEVNDSAENVFLLNYFVCDGLLRGLKEYFPLSRTIFVVHDQTWTERLLGDAEKFRAIMLETDTDKDERGNYYLLKRLALREKEMYQLADRVIVLNQDTEELLKTTYGIEKQKICLIPHGRYIVPMRDQSMAKTKARLCVNQDDQIMLFVGRTTKCKGFEAMLGAFEGLTEQFPKLKLVILGNVYNMETVLSLCPKSRTKVIYAGHVDKAELMMWYQIADVGVVPSYCEQLGYVGVEMLACGVPIVASDGIGLRSMFRDGYNAIVAPVGDYANSDMYVHNITVAVERLLCLDDQQRQQLCANARTSYLTYYTIGSMKEKYLRLFRGITTTSVREGSCSDSLPIPQRDVVYRLMLECNDMATRGFLTGRMGVVVALMEYAHVYRVKPIRDFCIYSINKTIENLPNNTSLDFASGLLGIGFALDYLHYRGLIDVDTSEVCEAIDKRLMLCSVLRMKDLSLKKGLEGLLMYVNMHIYNNGAKHVFDESFLAEIHEVLSLLPKDCTATLKRQAEAFEHMRQGKSEKPSLSLTMFVNEGLGNDISLCHGLAGQLVCKVMQ